MPAKPLPPDRRELVRRTYRECGSVSGTARRTGHDVKTVRKAVADLRGEAGPKSADAYPADSDARDWAAGRAPDPTPTRLPDPAPEAGGPALPESWAKPLEPYLATAPGWWLVLGDTHYPMHDRLTIELAVREAREKNAVGVLLNGDVMDMFGVSPFFREPSKETFRDELECGRAALAWKRSQLPKARFVYREGNHDFRLRRYIVERARELYDLEELRLPNLLGLDNLGVEWVQDKRKVCLGKLITLHGHELRKGEGVNPARLAFLRTTSSVLVGHHHRTSEHHQRGLDERHHAAWSVGCACFIHPDYDPYNQWNHGYAMVEVGSDGWFSVHNRRVLNGRVV